MPNKRATGSRSTVIRCPNCGEPIYEGDDYYYVTTAGQDVLVGCENCAGRRTARAVG